MSTWTAALSAIVAGACVSFARADLIANPSFEPTFPDPSAYYQLPPGSSTLPGWTPTDTGVEWFNPSAFNPQWAAYDGLYAVDLANYTYNAGGIEQVLTTTPGQTYTIRFALGTQQYSGHDGTCEIVVAAGTASESFNATNLTSGIVWSEREFTFTADSDTTTLSFRCLQNANTHFAYIDALSVVPAPGSGAVVGLVGAAMLSRRRSHARA